MKLKRIISGGQTGADIAGLRAARALGIKTGGWAPKGYMTERGPRPFVLGCVYGLKEHSDPRYPPRTLANIKDADCTLIFANKLDSGSGLTAKMALKNRKPAMWLTVDELVDVYPTPYGRGIAEGNSTVVECLQWLFARGPRIINIAGNRESKHPGIERRVQAFLMIVLDMYCEEIPF